MIVVELTKKEEQGARLFSLLEALNLNQTEFSKRIGVSQTYVNLMLKGTKSISYKVISGITRGFSNVNVRWLMTGDGKMFLEKKQDVVEEPPAPYAPANTEDLFGDLRALLEHYRYRIEGLEAEVVRLGERVRRLEGKENKKPD